MCVCVGAFVSQLVSLGMLSKRSHRLYLLICDSVFKTPLKLQHLLPESLEFLFNETLWWPPLDFTFPHSSSFFVFPPLYRHHLSPSFSKQSLAGHAFILAFHCVLLPTSFPPFLSCLCPTVPWFLSPPYLPFPPSLQTKELLPRPKR